MKRYDKDKKTKFNYDTINKDYLKQLIKQCKNLFAKNFSDKIFSDDFRKQVEAFKEMNDQINKKINLPIYLDNLDLILKIISVKILNNLNIKITKILLEFFDSLLVVLSENNYKLNEIEINIIINILIDNLFLNNNILKEHLLSLLNRYIEFLDTKIIMETVINVALNKHNKIKRDILDLTIDLVTKGKLNIYTKIYIKLFCKFLPFYENSIRTKVVSLFQKIYVNIGEELWNIIEISDDSKEFLEEKLQVVVKSEINEEDEKIGNNNTFNGKNKKINKNDDNIKNLVSKNSQITKENLDIILNNLFKEDPNEQLSAIIEIDENICNKYEQNKDILIRNIDKIITTFNSVLNRFSFKKDLNTLQIKFSKEFSILFYKVAIIKELISHLGYNILIDTFRELLLHYLLIKENHIKEKGDIILKLINSTIKQIMKNCEITFVMSALLELINDLYQKDTNNFVILVINCLI